MPLDNVNGVQEYDDSGSFIATTDINDLEYTVRALANKKYGYVIVSGERKPKGIEGWRSIVQQQLDERTWLMLMKKVDNSISCLFYLLIYFLNWRLIMLGELTILFKSVI